MLCRTVGAFATLALAANAFILPPTVAGNHEKADAEFTGLSIDTKAQLFKLPCSSCVFPSEEKAAEAEEGDGLFWAQGGAKDVLFNFTVTEDGSTLNLNDWAIYPTDLVRLQGQEGPSVSQVSSHASLKDIKHHPETVAITPLRITGDSFFTSEETVSKVGDKVVTITYQIASLEGQPMTIDSLDIKLLKSYQGELMIMSIEPIPGKPDFIDDFIPPPPPAPDAPAPEHEHGKEKECSMLPAAICKWKSIVESHIDGLRHGGPPGKFGGCGGRKGPRPHKLPGHIKPHFEQAADEEGRPHHHHGRPPKGMRPHGQGPHGPHGPHHHRPHHHVMHKFLVGFLTVLIPLMGGLFMGIFVSMIGFLVGRLIGFLWIKFRHGGQRGYTSVALDEEEDQIMEKGTAIVVEDVEALPKYEEAPEYVEKE
ncbi:hypothetical protein M8818_000619 [Zalaria obscura]|uniref:Uncharacterized protein n=1 Tax=Zalaria obscura TaxID=2024903 RepID=A0ACC3SMB7_9PEZI